MIKRLYAKITRLVSLLARPVTNSILHNSKRVRVLVIADNQILLQRTSIGHQKWGLPGGGVARRETPAEAAIREVTEEVGLHLSPKNIKFLGERFAGAYKNQTWPKVHLYFFEANLKKPEVIRISRPLEILEARWFPLSALPAERSQNVDIALGLTDRTTR